jgi:hypothetical protein
MLIEQMSSTRKSVKKHIFFAVFSAILREPTGNCRFERRLRPIDAGLWARELRLRDRDNLDEVRQ